MTLATHSIAPSASATSRPSAWAQALAKIIELARQRALTWRDWSNAPHTESMATTEANRVRHLAMNYLGHDPRFAADLLAAADRHEELHGC